MYMHLRISLKKMTTSFEFYVYFFPFPPLQGDAFPELKKDPQMVSKYS